MTNSNQPGSSLWLACLLFISFLTMMSCGGNEVDSKEIAQDLNKPKTDVTRESDERFMVRAAEFSLQEVQISKLAQQRSITQELKDLARTLEDKYREAKSTIASVGIVKSIAVPAVPTQAAKDAYAQLDSVALENFDMAYLDMLIQDHKDAIRFFENETRGNHDADVQKLATQLLGDIREHLTNVESIQSQMMQLSASAE